MTHQNLVSWPMAGWPGHCLRPGQGVRAGGTSGRGPGGVVSSPASTRPGLAGRAGEQADDLWDGQRDHARAGRGGWPRRAGGGAWVLVRSWSRAAVTAQMARAAMTSTVWRAIAV